MAWIELHEAVRDHWKIQRLAESMGVRYAEAEGWVCSLWLWCVSNAPNGDLSRFTVPEVAKGARCDVKQADLVEKMQEATLITMKKKVNDWQKYGVRKLEQNRRRQDAHRRKIVTLPKRDSNVPVTPTNQQYQPTVPTNIPTTSEAGVIVGRLIEKMRGNNPICKIPTSLVEWEKDADRLIRIDKRPVEAVLAVIDWCQADSFWKTNILSVTKLRKQFDQLWLKMNTKGGSSAKQAFDNDRRSAPAL